MNTHPIFLISSTGFVINSDPRGRLTWQGNVAGQDVISVLSVENHKQCVVLLDKNPQRGSASSNLMKVREDGTQIWNARLPDNNDYYVSARIVNGELWANSYSCHNVKIDWQTGELLKSDFTK